MLSLTLATELHEAGLRWDPAPGDRFTIRSPELLGDVFTVSEMTIQVHEYPTGTILGFNGTTEWALDSVTKDDTVWLPSEQQLRELLGPAFVSLHANGGDPAFVVTTRIGDAAGATFAADAAEDAYAHALLALMRRATA